MGLLARTRNKSLPVSKKEILHSVRIDKWLWAIRLFKSRSAATKACTNGKIKINGQKVNLREVLLLQTEINVNLKTREIRVRVIKLLVKRVSAVQAAICFEIISESLKRSYRGLDTAFYTMPSRTRGSGRPTKKERRNLDLDKDAI